MATIVLYGSNAVSADLPSASQMASASGGSEVPTYTSPITVATNQFLEFPSRVTGGTSYNSLPAPSGKGWVYKPGAGTFALGNWTASSTLDTAYATFTHADVRLYKYSSGVYTAIGTIQHNVNLTPKTTYTNTVSMPATTFLATDLLYIDVFWDDSTGAGDGQQLYISNSGTAGVVNDLQITTSNFTASGSVTNTWTADDDPLTPSDSISETLAQSTTDSVFAPTDTFSFATVSVTSRYFTRLRVGTTSYQFDVMQNDKEVAVGPSVPFTCTPGTFYWTKVRVLGNTLYGKVWADGSGEPAWTIITTFDAQVTTGSVGVMLSSTSASLPVKIDSLTITNLGGPVDNSVMALLAPLLMTGTDSVSITETPLWTLTQRVTDSLTTTETNGATEVQVATDSLTTTETAVLAKAQVSADGLSVLDADQLPGADMSLVQVAVDTLSVLDADQLPGMDFSKVQTGTDTLTVLDADQLAGADVSKVQTATDSLTVSENANFVALALIDQVTITEAGQESLALSLTDGALLLAETNATGLAMFVGDTLTSSEVNALLLTVMLPDALVAPTDSVTFAASTNIQLSDLPLAPSEGVSTGLAWQGSDACATFDAPALTLLTAMLDALATSDSLSASSIAVTNLADVACAPAESLALALQYLPLETATSSDTVFVAMAAVIIDIGVQSSESLARAFSVTGSDTLSEVEAVALTDAVAASDALGATESFLAVAQNKSSDVVTTVEGVLEGLAAFSTENVTSIDLSSSTGGFAGTDTSAITDSTAASYAYLLADSALPAESALLALAVFDQSQDAVSDAFTYLAIVGPSSVTVVEQNTVIEVLLAMVAVAPVDQVGTVDQSTTTTILAPVETLSVTETMAVFASPVMFLLDTVAVTETLSATMARTLSVDSVASFEFDALVIGYVPVDSLSSLETIAAFAVMTMSATDSNTAADLLKSASLFGPIDLTPVGEGLAALPFALAVSLAESVVTTDLVRGLVLAPFTDSVTLSSERLVASSTLTFADSLIMTDAATEGLTLFPGDTTLVVTDSMAYVRGNPLFVDTLVPSDGLILVLLSHPAPDTLLLGEQFTFSFQTVATALARVRSGRITMTKRTGSMRSRARTGIAVMVVRVGTLPTRVRSSTLSENVR